MIAVLLATYNSEKFLADQIDSVIAQTYSNWQLFIRDDGSTDKTVSIIKDYQAKLPDKIFLLEDEKGGLRSYGNFVELLKRVDADYYMFCDHDDVWLPHKIEISINKMKELEKKNSPQIPILVHTDMKVVGEQLQELSPSFWRYSRLLPDHHSFLELIACNCVNGCTVLFNQKAKEVAINNFPYCLMHDTLIAQSVAANNGIIYGIKEPTVLYRQHNENVIGAQSVGKTYYIQQVLHSYNLLKTNIEVWKRSCNIKKSMLCSFLITKLWINILRFKMI